MLFDWCDNGNYHLFPLEYIKSFVSLYTLFTVSLKRESTVKLWIVGENEKHEKSGSGNLFFFFIKREGANKQHAPSIEQLQLKCKLFFFFFFLSPKRWHCLNHSWTYNTSCEGRLFLALFIPVITHVFLSACVQPPPASHPATAWDRFLCIYLFIFLPEERAFWTSASQRRSASAALPNE